MKTRARKLIVIGLVASLAAACGDDDEGGTSTEAPAATDGGSDATAGGTDATAGGTGSTGATGTVELDTDDPFTMGLVLSSSGPIGVVGPQALLGVEAAVNEINANGGILGREVRVVTRDSASEVNTAVLGAREILDEEDPDFMLPDTLTTNALGILPLTTDAGIFTMNNASGAALNDPAQFPYHFVFANSKAQDVEAMAAGTKELVKLGKVPEVKKVALLIYNSGVAQIVQDEMNERFPEHGFDIVATELYEPTATDITVQLEKLRAADPDIIMLSAVGPGVVVAMTGLRDIGWDDAVVMADASSALQDLDQQLPPENKDNFYFPMLTPVTREGDTATSDVIERLEEVGPIESLFVSTLTYDIATWVAWAVNKAGSADGEAVQQVLESVGGLPESELPQGRALKINPGYSPENHSLGGGDLSQAFSLAYVGPLVSGTFPKLADLTIPVTVD